MQHTVGIVPGAGIALGICAVLTHIADGNRAGIVVGCGIVGQFQGVAAIGEQEAAHQIVHKGNFPALEAGVIIRRKRAAVEVHHLVGRHILIKLRQGGPCFGAEDAPGIPAVRMPQNGECLPETDTAVRVGRHVQQQLAGGKLPISAVGHFISTGFAGLIDGGSAVISVAGGVEQFQTIAVA